MTFRVLSYNIQSGGDDRLSQIIDVIQSQQLDAVALLEANSRSNAESLAYTLDMHLAYGEANSEFAIAWMSRIPIDRTRNHRQAVFAKTLLEIEVTWESAPLRLFATHLIHGRTEADAQRRTEEVRAILDLLHSLREQPHLLVGDYNAIHPDDLVGDLPPGEKEGYMARRPVQLLLEAGYVDCYRRIHPKMPGYTYPSYHPWLRLDYIFASPPMAERLSASGVIAGQETERSSDHLPVWAEFA